MFYLFGICLFLWFSSVCYLVWYNGITIINLNRKNDQQVEDLLDRLAYAQGRPYNYPERQAVPELTNDEETPEEGWKEL